MVAGVAVVAAAIEWPSHKRLQNNLPACATTRILRARLTIPGQVPEWSNGHDWKSCVLQKGTEGSNPSLSATPDGQDSLVTVECLSIRLLPGSGKDLLPPLPQHREIGLQRDHGVTEVEVKLDLGRIADEDAALFPG